MGLIWRMADIAHCAVSRTSFAETKCTDNRKVVGTQMGSRPHSGMGDAATDQQVIERQSKGGERRRPGWIEPSVRPPQTGCPQKGSVAARERSHIEIADHDHRAIKSLDHGRQRLNLRHLKIRRPRHGILYVHAGHRQAWRGGWKPRPYGENPRRQFRPFHPCFNPCPFGKQTNHSRFECRTSVDRSVKLVGINSR